MAEPGGSGAGSTVELDLSDFAQHVVTSEWLAEVKAKFTRLQMDLTQSRATEAELRARVERLDAVVDAARAWREEQLDPVDPSIPVMQAHYTAAEWALSEAIVALDAAEQPQG